MNNLRTVEAVYPQVATSDGAGVQLNRVIGTPHINMFDPFLLLDAFGSDKPQDYIGGFPSHPHRGFETVTYMLAGKMRHEDSEGNSGVIEAGGVQWMTAGRGVIHSEMPEQEHGLLKGFQLWVNLPQQHKMISPKYQETHAEKISSEIHDSGVIVKVIAGNTRKGTTGVIENEWVLPIYWDISQPSEKVFQESIPHGHNAFIYVYDGKISLSDGKEELTPISDGNLIVLTQGDSVEIKAIQNSKYILVAGKPLNEPVARGGPFVMNTKSEIEQALVDYRNGVLTR